MFKNFSNIFTMIQKFFVCVKVASIFLFAAQADNFCKWKILNLCLKMKHYD